MSSVWHRPQWDIGPGISPVTVGTMDDSRKRPGSPELASSTRPRRANDEINAHSSMLVAMTGTNSLFARLGTDYEIRNQWFFAISEAMTTD